MGVILLFYKGRLLLGARLAPTGHPRVAAWGPNQLASATLKKDFQHECCNKGHPLSILPRNASRSKKPEAYSINPVFGSKKHLINEWAISAFGPVRRSWRQTNREPRAPMATTNFTSAGPPAEDVPLNEQNGGFRPTQIYATLPIAREGCRSQNPPFILIGEAYS